MKPEGYIKREVTKILDKYKPLVYYHMPVLNGLGKPSLDYVGCCCGHYFTIETKAPGKQPTLRQDVTLSQVIAAQGKTFVINAVIGDDMDELEFWLERHVLSFHRRCASSGATGEHG